MLYILFITFKGDTTLYKRLRALTIKRVTTSYLRHLVYIHDAGANVKKLLVTPFQAFVCQGSFTY